MEKHVSLYFQQGSSDKEYHVHLRAKGSGQSGYVVDIEYGRRGSSLTYSTKTPSPVDLDEALKLFEAQVHSKKLKGYTEGPGQTPYVGGDKEQKISGVLPQLLNRISEEELNEYFDNDTFCMQEKKDGKRLLLSGSEGNIEAINRKGLFIGFPQSILECLSTQKHAFIIDGEIIGEVVWLFDILEFGGADMRKKPYTERFKMLNDKFGKLDKEGSAIRIVPAYFTPASKRLAFKQLEAKGVEGIVFKRLSSLYTVGRPASKGNQLKYKFTETCTVQVSGLVPGKRSVFVSALNGKTLIELGKVTVLPNFDVPKIGDLIEVEYLYRHVHGALYQPVFLGVRDDLDGPDQISSMKLKEGIDLEEEE